MPQLIAARRSSLRRLSCAIASVGVAGALLLPGPIAGSTAAQTHLIADQEPTGSISGRVTGPGGLPLEGIDVEAFNTTHVSEPGPRTKTAADGTYTISGVAAGQYAVAFIDVSLSWASGYYSAITRGFSVHFPAVEGEVTVGTGPVGGIDVELRAGRHVSGHLLQPNGTPVGGFGIWLCGPASGLCGPSGVTTDLKGAFKLTLAPGTFDLQVRSGSAIGGFYAKTGGVLNPSLATPIVVGSADISGINVRLPSFPIPSFANGSQLGQGSNPEALLIVDEPTTGDPMTTYKIGMSTDGGAYLPVAEVTGSQRASVKVHLKGRFSWSDESVEMGADEYLPLTTPAVDLRLVQEYAGGIKYTGSWGSIASSGASGGHAKVTTAKGATATFTFTGSDFAWLTMVGPNQGMAKIYLDGKFGATVNLHAGKTKEREVAYSHRFADAFATHTVKWTVTSSGKPVSIDGFLTEGTPLPPPSHILTVTTSGTGTGVVHIGESVCPPNCAVSFAGHQFVDLIAIPDKDSTFGGWSGRRGARCRTIGVNSCEVDLNGNVTIDFRFDGPPQPVLTRILAEFDPATFTTTYWEIVAAGQNLTFEWAVAIPADPPCGTGFTPNSPADWQATWFHKDVSQGGLCNHSGGIVGPRGHPGTVAVVVRNAFWRCGATYEGTEGNNGSATGEGDPPQPCTRR